MSSLYKQSRDGLLFGIFGSLLILYLIIIAPVLLSWIHPDEMIVFDFRENTGSCVSSYYLESTVNRLSAGIVMCGLSYVADFFNSLFVGWAVARLILLLAIPFALAFFLNRFFVQSLLGAVHISLVICAVGLTAISALPHSVYTLDLSIYAVGTISFFLALGFLDNRLNQVWHRVIGLLSLAVCLNAHEIYLVLMGILIGVYGVKCIYEFLSIKKLSFGQTLISLFVVNKYFSMVCAIYIVSAALNLLAPGVEMRQKVWPTTGTSYEGFIYMYNSFLGSLLFLKKFMLSFLLLFGLGILAYKYSQKRIFHLGITIFVMLSPLVLFGVTAYLIGLTPSLRAGGDHLLAIRQTVPIFIGVAVAIFIFGFWISGLLRSCLRHTKIFHLEYKVFDWFPDRPQYLSRSFSLSVLFSIILFCVVLIFIHPNTTKTITALDFLLFEKPVKNIVRNSKKRNDDNPYTNVNRLNNNQINTAFDSLLRHRYISSLTPKEFHEIKSQYMDRPLSTLLDQIWLYKAMNRYKGGVHFKCDRTLYDFSFFLDYSACLDVLSNDLENLKFVEFKFGTDGVRQLPKLKGHNAAITSKNNCQVIKPNNSPRSDYYGYTKLKFAPGIYYVAADIPREQTDLFLSLGVSNNEIFWTDLTMNDSEPRKHTLGYQRNVQAGQIDGHNKGLVNKRKIGIFSSRSGRNLAIVRSITLFRVYVPTSVNIRIQTFKRVKGNYKEVCNVKIGKAISWRS